MSVLEWMPGPVKKCPWNICIHFHANQKHHVPDKTKASACNFLNFLNASMCKAVFKVSLQFFFSNWVQARVVIFIRCAAGFRS